MSTDTLTQQRFEETLSQEFFAGKITALELTKKFYERTPSPVEATTFLIKTYLDHPSYYDDPSAPEKVRAVIAEAYHKIFFPKPESEF